MYQNQKKVKSAEKYCLQSSVQLYMLDGLMQYPGMLGGRMMATNLSNSVLGQWNDHNLNWGVKICHPKAPYTQDSPLYWDSAEAFGPPPRPPQPPGNRKEQQQHHLGHWGWRRKLEYHQGIDGILLHGGGWSHSTASCKKSTKPYSIPQRNSFGRDLSLPINTNWNWPWRKEPKPAQNYARLPQ